MKKPLPFFKSFEGTIMIFSLVIILGGTLVLAAWAQMLATRATYSVMTEEGQKRRIALANGRALARQYVLNQMPSGSISNFSTNLANGWGGFQINSASALWTNANFSVGNPFNQFCDTTFVVTNGGHVSNNLETYGWTFLIRSRSPLLAGYPLTIQNPGTTNLAWASNAYKIYWSNALGFSNAPDIPFTSGTTASGAGSTNGYIGYFASPMNTNYAYTDVSGLSITNGNTNGATYVSSTNPSTNTNMYITNYTGGSVTLVLNSTQTNSITRYAVPNTVTNIFSFTNTVLSKTNIRNYSNAAVTNLMLVGSTNTNALHLIVNSSTTNLNTLTLSGTNNTRRIYLNKNGGSLTNQTATYTSSYAWWMGMTLSNCTTSVYAPTNANKLTLQGGIRSDGTINVNQGNLSVISSTLPAINGTNVSDIETIADRIMWLEEQRNP